ncbi:unnamed protein product [Prorocentrum cordatum]|uniref:SCP domain-containing protein n=1 Tax=Prorocentrum cordatum TaxID=2364126 RepID=A0ABN9X469_9DINO|nr:unnamed protein product [Polarella glacialis]
MAGRSGPDEKLIVEAGAAVDNLLAPDAKTGGGPTEQPRPCWAARPRSLAAALLASAVLAALALAAPRALAERGRAAERAAALGAAVSLADTSAAMLDAVNEARQSEGLPNLCFNEKLNTAAQQHSDDMKHHFFISHTGTDDSSPEERVERAGYNWAAVAENVAKGQETVAVVMASWMNSPGHKANILHTGITHFGFGNNGVYWTQVFGASRGGDVCIGAESSGGGHDDDASADSEGDAGGSSGESENAGGGEEGGVYQCCIFDHLGISIACYPEKQWWMPWCPGEVAEWPWSKYLPWSGGGDEQEDAS